MSSVIAIIATGISWNNSPLDYEVKTADDKTENIRFEIGSTGHPEALNLPSDDEGYEHFRVNPEFTIIHKGDGLPPARHYDIDKKAKEYLNSMTARAIPFLERSLKEGAVGRHQTEVEKHLVFLKAQVADKKKPPADKKEPPAEPEQVAAEPEAVAEPVAESVEEPAAEPVEKPKAKPKKKAKKKAK